MTPRTDNPALYRENVYKSWKLMQYVVSHVNEECFIVHLEPNPGVGYDCLSLVTREAGGGTRVRFMLNRNGTSAGRIQDVWNRISNEGIEAIAGELMFTSQLSFVQQSRMSSTAQLCGDVVSWIEQHRDEEFCVGPIGWPGGCRVFADVPRQKLDWDIWPIEESGPEIVCGIGFKESTRFRFGLTADGASLSDETDSGVASREFRDVGHALSQWTPLINRPEVWEEIQQVIDKAIGKLGSPIRVHIPAQLGYIAVTFQGEPKKVGAYIGVGYVDCIVETSGSSPHSTAPYWRTILSTFRGGQNDDPSAIIATELCPECFLAIPVTGECGCGWRPN